MLQWRCGTALALKMAGCCAAAGLERLKKDETSVKAWASFLSAVVQGPDAVKNYLAVPDASES